MQLPVTGIDSLRILEEMSDTGEQEFSIFQAPEADDDQQLGLPKFREHTVDSLTPAVLRDWTARDFASIYVRFRPHLERHAKKLLTDPTQVEEVVQDAFLYLMTSLPELDSELGVLKFLKWKVRMLSVDIIRANRRAELTELEDGVGILSVDGNISEGLERAEDAAVVALALAKLQPRHREALIATLYEEKSSQEVAVQMGMSENALRQLLFRARAAFKRSLVGETDVSGRSISEILSLAARKAAKSPSPAAALLVTLVLALGTFPLFATDAREAPVASRTSVSSVDDPRLLGQNLLAPVPIQQGSSTGEPNDPAQPTAPASKVYQDGIAGLSVETQESPVDTGLGASDSADEIQLRGAAFAWASQFLDSVAGSPEMIVLEATNSSLVLELGGSTTITMLVTPDENQLVSSVVVSAKGPLQGLVAIPTGIHQEPLRSANGMTTVRLIMTGFAVGDLSGTFGSAVIEDAHFSEIAVAVTLNFEDESLADLSSATAEFLPRT